MTINVNGRFRVTTEDKWFLDEVFLKINGVQHYLWRAVDQHGAVIDILVQAKRDRFAAISGSPDRSTAPFLQMPD